MATDLGRRDFLAGLGVTVGGAALGVGGELAVAGSAVAQETVKGRVPETPVKFGHITIQSGPGAILGLPSLKGHTLAAEEINAAGGLLGRRRIETITADEAAGPEATVKELKRMKLVEKIDYFSGVIAAHNQLFKTAVERANKQDGGWPEDDAIIKQLEGLSIEAPAGLVTVRKEDHRAFKDVKVGFSKNLPDYPFPVWDPERIITIHVSAMTAPPNWPKPGKGHNDPSATVNWIKTTWPKAGA